ncbi:MULTISPECIES: hypothetical protein [Chryseobacterium]|uniref:Uncharacterized protein n=1 Tax=Chryseobacterium geocarposphaerae TaxID=1416776 RepID=A0ABU1LIE5_9FLAO|nr:MULTISPECIES: hypothetical protein [Chryseobacterium]MDR6406497.1 hypothetical protein [Chryseobacterium geocarposphaerae]MDR6699933.1 hypothetical protein [Chryseobacterium ginsenosidimutans]
MVKLSDYLDYLNNEIIQARKKADENAVAIAKEYAKHEYLKYFKVPRYSLPSVKMDIPIKITDIDSDADRNFPLDESKLIDDVNKRILVINKERQLNIQPISTKTIQNDDFKGILNNVRGGGGTESSRLSKIETTTQTPDIKPLPTRTIAATPQKPVARPTEGTTTEEESTALKQIYSEVLNRYSLINSKLNNIYIDPNTNSAEDKDKLFINLHVEMEEEGIRIVSYQDKDGKTIEQITFE